MLYTCWHYVFLWKELDDVELEYCMDMLQGTDLSRLSMPYTLPELILTIDLLFFSITEIFFSVNENLLLHQI